MHDADRRQSRLRLHGPTEGRRDCPCAVAEESLDPGSRHRDRPTRRAALAATVTTNCVSRNAVVALYARACRSTASGCFGVGSRSSLQCENTAQDGVGSQRPDEPPGRDCARERDCARVDFPTHSLNTCSKYLARKNKSQSETTVEWG